MTYRSEDRRDRLKAIAGVLVVHVALGAAILTGLNVNVIGETVDHLRTFDVPLPELPPPVPPPPPEQAEEQQGAPAAPKASPVVAPKPEVRLPVQNPIAAAPEPGTGASSSAGQGGVGSGTGAGGTGTGAGSGAGFTPARRISKIPNSEYRRFVRSSGMSRGSVGLTVKVNTDGRPSDCRIVRSSGNSATDSLMCQLTVRYVRFRPARDPQGRPVAQDITWYPDWAPNR